jgi:hypothetical protein
MIDAEVFERHWKELRNPARQRWLALTARDIDRIDGHVDVLVELLQEKYGYPAAQAETEVNRFLQETVGSGATEG